MAKRATQEAWAKAKGFYEDGKSLRQITALTGIDGSNISKQAKQRGWQKDVFKSVLSEEEQNKIKWIKASNILYIITAKEFDGIYKIGITNDINSRLSSMQTGCPYNLFAFKAYETKAPATIEKMLHIFFNKKHVRGEWFRLDEKDLQYIDDALSNVDEVINGLQ
jgi:hypothetical protein